MNAGNSFIRDFHGVRSEKISQKHWERVAVLYVRQSTNHQLLEHRESTERQYGLKHRITALGWAAEKILVVDDDLGLTGSRSGNRQGFQRVLQEITAGRVGMVMGLEMSRLARNSKDWHDLFEVCGIFDALIADEDGVFDPNLIDDRLVLGMKGIISELELHTMKTRLERGRLNKARRGELFHVAPVGYVLSHDGLPIKDPDAQAQLAIQMLFDKFDELGSAHAVYRYCVSAEFKLPFRNKEGDLDWRIPGKATLYGLWKHPLYAGTYGYGRRKNYRTKRKPASSFRKHLPPNQWKVCIHDLYPAYITWERYLQNQERLRQNDNRPDRTGPPREGTALLSGILHCGHCHRKLHPKYNKNAQPSYSCSRHLSSPVTVPCQGAIQGARLDQLVADRLLDALRPANLELSLRVIEDEELRRQKQGKLKRQAVERARYEAQRAERQYNVVDPENRLVAASLEKKWEACLAQQTCAETELESFNQQRPIKLSAQERAQLVALSSIETLWHSSLTSIRDRKRIVRCLVEKVVATVQEGTEFVDVSIHWQGGCISRHELIRRVGRYSDMRDYPQLIERLIELRKTGMRSPRIAETLNSEGFSMARQSRPFTGTMIAKMISSEPYKSRLRDPVLNEHEWRIEALSGQVGIPVKKLKHWVNRGWLHAVQRPFASTWVLWADDDEINRLKRLNDRPRGQRPARSLLRPKQRPT